MRQVKFLRTHAALHLPNTGVGDIGNTLPAAGKTFSRLDMKATDNGVEVTIAKTLGARTVCLLVPWGAIQVAELAPEAEPNTQ